MKNKIIIKNPVSKCHIFWNNTDYAKISLVNEFGKGNVLKNSDDFDAIKQELGYYDSLIVLCELEWSLNGETTQRHQLSGIELVKELRRDYNIICPVLFVSFLPIKFILNTEREIITAIGHDFLQLPATPSDFKRAIDNSFSDGEGDISKLSEMELTDIKSFYCSKEGLLTHELHQLNAYLHYTITDENHNNVYAELEKSISRIHELFLENSTTVLNLFQHEYPKLTKDNINGAVNYIIQQGNILLRKYSNNIHGNQLKEKHTDQFRWKVLLLDDEINENHELILLMKKNGINVIFVNTALDALSALYDDWRAENQIMVVIADYRLYEYNNGIKRHQKVQGYQFLKNIASSDHLIRLVAFSGLQRKFLLNSFKHFNIRTEVKSKTDYLSSEQTQQIFCDEIIEMAEENLEVIEEMPSKCAGFKKSLEDAYKAFRMHPNYYKMESNISLAAKEYVWEIKQQIQSGEERIIIGAIENIKAPLAKKKKDEEAYFKRLNNYFIARRITLWLYAAGRRGYIPIFDSRKIVDILTETVYNTDAYRQIISTNLGLSLDDFPNNITIEERRWLQYEMQLNIFRDINLIVPVFSKIGEYYKDFISSNIQLKEHLENNNYNLIRDYKKVSYSIRFQKDFTPDIKTATDVRFVYLFIDDFFNEDNKIDHLKPLVSKIRLLLFDNRTNVIYLKNIFQYFNDLYRDLNKEKSLLTNVAKKINDKESVFIDKSRSSIQDVFESVYLLLNNDKIPDQENYSADVFSIFISGEEVVNERGRIILKNKVSFFIELTNKINETSSLSDYTLNDNVNHTNRNNNFYDDSDDSENQYELSNEDEENEENDDSTEKS